MSCFLHRIVLSLHLTVGLVCHGGEGEHSDEAKIWENAQREARERMKREGDPKVTDQVIELLKKASAGELIFRESHTIGVYGDGGSEGVCFELSEEMAMEVFVPFWEKDRFKGKRTGLQDIRFQIYAAKRIPREVEFQSDVPLPPYEIELSNRSGFSESVRERADLARVFKELVLSDRVDPENVRIKHWRELLRPAK